MTAHLLHKLLFLPPVWAVSIAKWLFLTLGVWAFWQFLSSRWQRWVFAVLWFFPPFEMMNLLLPGHPYAEQMALIALALLVFDRFLSFPSFQLIAAFIALAFTSIWVSDFSLLFFTVLPVVFFKKIVAAGQQLFHKPISKWILFPATVTFLSVAFLVYAKSNTIKDDSYLDSMFSNSEQLLHTLTLLWFYTKNVLLFDSVTWWNSLMFYATLFTMITFFILRDKIEPSPYTRYFFLTSLLGFLLLVSLRWVSINFVMLKYFIPVFVGFWVGLFSVVLVHLSVKEKSLVVSLSVLMSLGASGSLLHMYNQGPVDRFNYAKLSQIHLSKPRYILGDYWHSYVLGIEDPRQIQTTPHDQQFVRNPKMRDEVMASDTLLIVTNDWLETAPDTLMPFGHTLVNTKQQWTKQNFDFVAYKNLGLARSY
jgi:hypothetical protein